ncbi:uncharacterized protein LOC132549268 [Ylistrum balloti]|uniref:uncharacterized protein LOC132549268 n=1 Tax=Ylistrum balloti TaxID=509963 RepID=UPI0029057FC1|nr:uncharacterized protein LOC132549268 [Ylistrum balloti]
MDFSALSSELQNIAGRYNGRDTDPAYSTTMYCEMFHKILQKTETEVHDYADQIVILWMTLSQLCNTANTLAPCPARHELYQDIFLQCAKTVLNIKWQNLAEDDHSKENFIETVKATHVQLVTTGFDRFSLLLHLMENPWTDPTLSEIMSGEADNDDDAVQTYIGKESSLILKLRVEMLMQENCEEFALNLCNTLMGHEVFVKDMDLRETQLKLLHKLNQMDKLQEVCEKIVCHDGVKLVLRLEQKECNQALSVRLIQIFLVQDWIKPEQKCCTQELLKLWIRHQYIADHNKEKFLDSVWAIAKLSLTTQQILLLVSGLQRECGNEMIQLYTDLCVYAINVDKGCCEQQMLQGNMEGVKERQQAIAQTCRKLSALYNGLNPKISRISSLTAFSLDASLVNLCLVERMFNRKYCTHSKKECAACIKVFSSVTHCVGDVKVNPATLYEVERLLNMLRPYYLNPDLAWKELLPVCQKFMKERNQSSGETKEETTPPKTPPKKKDESKPRAKKPSVKKEMNISPGNIKYYCDDNVSYLPKESVPKMKNKNFRLKSAASSTSCTQTPKSEEAKAKQHTVKPVATPSKASAVFEFDKQLYQYNFKGRKPLDTSSPFLSSSTVARDQISPAGSELSNRFATNHPKTPTQVANVKCQAVGVDSLGKPVLVKLPITVGSHQSTTTLSSTVSTAVAPAASPQTLYIGDTSALSLQSSNPNGGLHVQAQGKIQKPKKRQPHSIGELLEATKIMPCSTSSNFTTAATVMANPKPATQPSLPTSADLLRAARDYNLTIVQKPATPKPFQTQYSTADLLRATKNIPQKSKPEVQSASNLQSAKDMMQATKAAFAASVLGFIPKPQSTILSEVSKGTVQTSGDSSSVHSSGLARKQTKKPKASKKTVNLVPGQILDKAMLNEMTVSQCNNVQTSSNRTVIAHSYKTADGNISFLSSNVVGASNNAPPLTNPLNVQTVSPVRPTASSYQVTTNDKTNHRPRIIPVRATGNSKFPPYSSAVVAVSSTTSSPGQGANTVVTTSQSSIPSTQTHIEPDIYNMFTKEKPVLKQSPAASKIEGFRRPSADELQSIVDWLQTGTEDDKKKVQTQPKVSTHVTTSTQEMVISVPSTVQSRTPPSVVTPNATSTSSMVLSSSAVTPKMVSLTPEQLQKIMAGLSQRQKMKQKSPTVTKIQQKKGLNKQLQQLLAKDINDGNQSEKYAAASGNNLVQGDVKTVQSSSTPVSHLVQPNKASGNQLVQQLTIPGNQIVQTSTTPGNQIVQTSKAPANQLVQPLTAPANQLVQPLTAPGNQLVQPLTTPANQLVQPLTTPANQLVQPSTTLGNQLVQTSTTRGNQLVQTSTAPGNQLVQQFTTHGNQLVQQLAASGNQLVQPLTALGNQLVQQSSTHGNQLVQPLTAPGNQLVQPLTALGNQLVQQSSTHGNQIVQSSIPQIGPLVQPTTMVGSQLVLPSATHVSQIVQQSTIVGNQLIQPSTTNISQLVQPSTTDVSQLVQHSTLVGNQLVQASTTPPSPSPRNEPSLVEGNQASLPPSSLGNQDTQPSEISGNQPIQQSQNQKVILGNSLHQSQTAGTYVGNQQIPHSQVQQGLVHDTNMTSNSSVKSQHTPAITLPVSSPLTVSQSLPSIDQLANAMQTTSTPGIQSSLSFPSQFQISGSKSLTLSPNQPTTRVFELQYLGHINPPSKVLHPKSPSKDNLLTPSTTAPGDQVSHQGKSSELLLETNLKASDLQGLMRSKQPTFIPKTISSADELNIPKMPLGTLKVVEKPDLISTLNRSPARLSIDHNPSATISGGVGNQQRFGESCEPAVTSYSDHGVSTDTGQDEQSSKLTLPVHCNTIYDVPSTSKVSYPQNSEKAPTGTHTSSNEVVFSLNENSSVCGRVKDVSNGIDSQTNGNTVKYSEADSGPVSLATTSELTSSSERDGNVNNIDSIVITPDTSSEKKVLQTNCEDFDKTSEKESKISTETADSTISPELHTLTMYSDGDARNQASVVNKQHSNEGKDNFISDQFQGNNTDVKNDKKSEGQVSDSTPFRTMAHVTGDVILPTPKGDNLAGEAMPMIKVPSMQNTERLPEKVESKAANCSMVTSKESNLSSMREEDPGEPGKDILTPEPSQGVFKKIEEGNLMDSTSSTVTSSAEHAEKVSDNVTMVSTCVSDNTSGTGDTQKNSKQSCANADNFETGEDTVKDDKVLTLDDALGESAALLSAPMVPFPADPTQQVDNLTSEYSNPNLSDKQDKSSEKSDVDAESAQPEVHMRPTQESTVGFEFRDGQGLSVQTTKSSQDTLKTMKPLDEEGSIDSMKRRASIEDMAAENQPNCNNSDHLDSDPNKGWENAFVSFIDNLGEKKTVKSDPGHVQSKPVFSRQDSSGSESSSRSVGSSLSSRGSHKSLDEDNSGTRILPLQRRENDVKRFEYFSHISPSLKSSKKRLSSKGLSGIQIQALPEIKAKTKSSMKLVPTVDTTEAPQQKEVIVNKCIICSKTFRSVDSLKCHVRNICRPMDISRPEANLKDFEYGTVYSCHKCEKEVSKKEEIKAHVSECCKDDDVIQALSFSTKYMCQMCGEFFANKDDVHSHVSRLCSKVMSCRQQQQERLDRKIELTAKPLSDIIESLNGNGQQHTDDDKKNEVQEKEHMKDEEKKSLGVDDLESEIFKETKNQLDVDIKEEDILRTEGLKQEDSVRSLPAKQWSLRNKTKFSSRLKGFEFFSNKLNPARRRTEQRKWHEDYHSLRNRVVKKEAVKQMVESQEGRSVEYDGKTYAKHKKFPKVATRDDSLVTGEHSEDDADIEIGDKEERITSTELSPKMNDFKAEVKEHNDIEIQNHTSAKLKGAQRDVAGGNTMDPPMRQKRVIQVGKKFSQDEFEVPEFLKIQMANSNLKRKSPQHCPKCGQFFSSSYVLIQHVVRVHMSPCKSKWNSSARKFQFACWYCSDAFPTYIKFSKHVPVHKDKILAMLKKNCSTSRRLRREGSVINNISTRISKTKTSLKGESAQSLHKPVDQKEPSPIKETEVKSLSQHVESMRTSRRARGQPPLAIDVPELKVETTKKERSRSREKDSLLVSGMISPSGSLSPGTLDMRTTRSRRRDNDSLSTSSFDHDDDIASNCSHATDKSSLSRGRRDYNKRGLSEDRESMTSEDSVCHRPVTRHQVAAHISPTLQDSPCTAKKPKLARGQNTVSDQSRSTRTRSGNTLTRRASLKSNNVDHVISEKQNANTKPKGKVTLPSSKTGPSKGCRVTRNQCKLESDSKKNLNDCVSQLRHARKEGRTGQNVLEKETSVKGLDISFKDGNNPASSVTTRRSRRLNNSVEVGKGVNTAHENCSKRSAVVKLNRVPLTRHKSNEHYNNCNSTPEKRDLRKINTKSNQEKVVEPKKRKLSAIDQMDDSSKKFDKIETEGDTSSHVETLDQKSVLIVSEEDEEFVYVKSPLSSPGMSPRGGTPEEKEKQIVSNSATVDSKTAFLESFKKYIHKPTPRWTNPFQYSMKSKVAKSKLKQKVCLAQARLLKKRKRNKMGTSGFSSEDEADDELDEDVNHSKVSENSNEKKSFLDSFIAHCDHGPRLKGYYSEDLPVMVPMEDSTADSTGRTLPKGKKALDSKRKGPVSQRHQVKKDVINKSEKNIESKMSESTKLDTGKSDSEWMKEKVDDKLVEVEDKDTDMDCSEEVKSITEIKECKSSIDQGNKVDQATARPTSFESLQTYIDSMSNSASPTPSVDSTTSKDTLSKKSLKISKSMASTFQDSFMTYLGSKPKKGRKTSDGSCSSSECGDVKSCNSSVCDGDTGVGQKSRVQKSQSSKPFTWDVDSGDERIDLLVSTLGRVVTETSESGSKTDLTFEGPCVEEMQSETSHSERSSVERILPQKHSHSKAKVRRIYHDGKIWEIGPGSVKSVSVVQSDLVTTERVPGRDSPVSEVSDCGESTSSINTKSDPVNISRSEVPKGDNRTSPLKPDHHHLSKSSKIEQNSQLNVEMIRVDRKHDGEKFVRLDKSEIDQYDKMNTYTSVTPEDMALKKAENIKKSAKWKVKTEKRSKSSNMKEFPFVFKKNRRM